MSTDRGLTYTSVRKKFMRKGHNQHWVSKTAKMTKGVYVM